MRLIYITGKNAKQFGKSRVVAPHADNPNGYNGKSQTFSFPKLPFAFDDHHQNLRRQYQAPAQPLSQRHPDPLSRFARMQMWTDRQTDCGALWCIAEALRTTGTLPNYCSLLRRIAVQVVHAAAECITH